MCAIVSQPASQHCLLTLYYDSLLCVSSINVCVLLLLLGFRFTNIFLYRDVFCFTLSQTVTTAAAASALVADMLFCYHLFYAFTNPCQAFCNLHSIVLNVCASLPFDKEFLFIHRSRRRRCRLCFFFRFPFISCFVTTFRRYFDITVVSVVVSSVSYYSAATTASFSFSPKIRSQPKQFPKKHFDSLPFGRSSNVFPRVRSSLVSEIRIFFL